MSIKNLFPLLDKEDIELRVGQKSKDNTKKTLLLYKTARTDAYYLDNVVGIENWTCRYYELKNHIYCSVGINFNGTWVYKDDAGSESNVEQEKGEASDALTLMFA